MKIVVIGGSGLIGKKLVGILREGGHEVVPASPSSGVNTVTGQGLSAALAGAQVVVSSLWPVPDGVISDQMAHLYEHLDRPIYERVRSSQLARMKELNSNHIGNHPYSWAAMISLGNWR